MEPHKENVLTPTPYRTVSLRREPYRMVRKKQQHRTMLLLQSNHPHITHHTVKVSRNGAHEAEHNARQTQTSYPATNSKTPHHKVKV